jgi:hypothetical protein
VTKVNDAFIQLWPVRKSSCLSLATERFVTNTNVKPVVLHACETGGHNTTIISKLQVFLIRFLRRILNIRWPDTISSEGLWRKESSSVDCLKYNVENGNGLVTVSANVWFYRTASCWLEPSRYETKRTCQNDMQTYKRTGGPRCWQMLEGGETLAQNRMDGGNTSRGTSSRRNTAFGRPVTSAADICCSLLIAACFVSLLQATCFAIACRLDLSIN